MFSFPSEYKEAISCFDSNGKGKIPVASIVDIFKILGHNLPDSDAEQMMTEYADGEGGGECGGECGVVLMDLRDFYVSSFCCFILFDLMYYYVCS